MKKYEVMFSTMFYESNFIINKILAYIDVNTLINIKLSECRGQTYIVAETFMDINVFNDLVNELKGMYSHPITIAYREYMGEYLNINEWKHFTISIL